MVSATCSRLAAECGWSSGSPEWLALDLSCDAACGGGGEGEPAADVEFDFARQFDDGSGRWPFSNSAYLTACARLTNRPP